MTDKKSRFAGIAEIRSKLATEPEQESAEPTGRMGRPKGKSSDPNFTQVTVYMRKDVHRSARKLLFDDGRQFSDLVGDLVSKWVATSSKKSEVS